MKRYLLLIVFTVTLLFQSTVMAEYEGRPARVLTIMYHMISDTAPAGAFCITSEAFEHDIKTLKEEGFNFCTADDIKNVMNGTIKGDNFVAITFDDGYESDLSIAVPILKKYDAKATFFIIGSNVGTPGYVTKSDLKELASSKVAQIGNHTFEFHNMTREEFYAQSLVYPDKVLKDIEKNQKFLKDITGKEITALSFPYGIYKPYINNKIRDMGIVTFSTEEKTAVLGNEIYGRFNRDINRPIEDILRTADMRKGYTFSYALSGFGSCVKK